jgi:hypothetical protein
VAPPVVGVGAVVVFGAQAVSTRLARTRTLSTNVNFFITSLSFVEIAVSEDGVQDMMPVSSDDISIDQLLNYDKRKRVISLRLIQDRKRWK